MTSGGRSRPAGGAPGLPFLLDCDLSSHGLVRLLERRGHDVLAAGLVAGVRELDDVDLFELAQRERRIVRTHNLADFPDILAERSKRSSSPWGQTRMCS